MAGSVQTMMESLLTRALPLLVLLLLPTLGLYAGPSYGPLILGCGFVLWLYGLFVLRRPLRPPPVWGGLALGMLLAVFASLAWTVDRGMTLRAAPQMALVLLGCCAMLAVRPLLSGDVWPLLARWFPWALLAGALFMLVDGRLDYALSHGLGRGETAPVKYNRGVNYLMIVIWPLVALLLVHRQRVGLGIMAVALGLVLTANQSSTAYVQLAGAGAVFAVSAGLGMVVPSLMPTLLVAGAALVGGLLPFLLASLTYEHRQTLWLYVKHSAAHRVEIWDYLSHYVLQKPWLGWGFGTATALKPSAEQLATYRRVDPNGIYPHNQWLELWLGLGAVGLLLGLCFLFLVWRGLMRLPPSVRPYGCAAFASAQILCLTSFELTTDSWWAALTVCALLLAWPRPSVSLTPH